MTNNTYMEFQKLTILEQAQFALSRLEDLGILSNDQASNLLISFCNLNNLEPDESAAE